LRTIDVQHAPHRAIAPAGGALRTIEVQYAPPLPCACARGASSTVIGRRTGPGSFGPVRILGLDHVQVAGPAGCEAEARRFYGALLGLDELEKPEPLRARGGVWFQIGDQQLHVGVDREFAAARKAHPALLVAPGDLSTIADRLAVAGAGVQWDQALPGTRRLYSEDPWGNRLEFVEADGP
jgi:catechol 2,3-dioxygenase-like lactoylglutathione lyase family enzyme